MPPKTQNTPKNWPHPLPYLTANVLSGQLSKEALSTLKQHNPGIYTLSRALLPGPCSNVKITPITNTSHPANGQNGLFATKHLAPGSFILSYLGVIHSKPGVRDGNHHSSTAGGEGGAANVNGDKSDLHAESDYDLSLDRFLGIGIDAALSGSEARFINDYRGVGARANAEFCEVWDERAARRGMAVFVMPEGRNNKGRFKGIAKGEEILVSYGRGFWVARRDEEEEREEEEESLETAENK